MSIPREVMLRVAALLLLAGPGVAALCWPHSPPEKGDEAQTRSEAEPGKFPLTDSSTDDCLAIIIDDLASLTDRLQAVNALARRGESGLKLLHGMLRHRSPAVRRYASIGVAQFGPRARAALPELLHLMTDSDVSVRIAAVDALVRVSPRDQQTLDAVLNAFHSESSTLQLSSCDALRAIVRACPERSDEFEQILMDKLEISPQSVKFNMITTLADCSPPRTQRLLEVVAGPDPVLRMHAITTIGALGKFGTSAIPNLLQLTDCRDDHEKVVARRALSRLACASRVPLVEGLSPGNSLAVRTEAALQLAMAHPDEAPQLLPVLEQAAREMGHEPFVWARLQLALHSLGKRARSLSDGFQQSPEEHLRSLSRASTRTGSPREVMELWLKDLNHQSPIVRTRAAYRMGLVPQSCTIVADRLSEYRFDDNPEVSRAVIWAVSQVESTIGPIRSMHASAAYAVARPVSY